MEANEPGAVRRRSVASVCESRMMWCAECQLDAPALAVPEEPGVIRCAYCRNELVGRREEEQETADRKLGSAARGQEPGVGTHESAERGRETNDVSAVESSLPLLAFLPPPLVDDGEADSELAE